MAKKRRSNDEASAKPAAKKKHKKDRRREPAPEPAPADAGRKSPVTSPGMSDALLNMKFMRRAAEPAPADAPAPAASSKAVKAEAYEPKRFGRRSFGGFNPAVEAAEREFYASFAGAAPAAEKKVDDSTEGFGSYIGARKAKKKGSGKGLLDAQKRARRQ